MTVSEDTFSHQARAKGKDIPGDVLMLLLLVLVMPLMASPPLAARLLDIPGLKLPNLLAAITFLAMLNSKASWKITDRLQKGALIVFCAYLAILVVAFLRSLQNIPRFHALEPESFHASATDYWQSYLVVPVLFALSFVYVLQRMCSRTGLERTVTAISLAMFGTSCAVILVMLSHPSIVLEADPDRNAVNMLTENLLGMHYNGLGTVYIISAPLLLYMAFARGSLWALNLVLAIAAVLLLKSRTAIFTFAIMGATTLVVLGRVKALVALAPVVAAAAVAVLGGALINLLSLGITKSGISIFVLLSGREQAIWLPLLGEWTADPDRFWFGTGLFGVLTSDFLYSSRSIFAAGQAHNFYLEFFLDNGIVAFSLFVCALLVWLRWSWRLGRQLHSQLYWVFFLCVVSFLIAGFTGRRYFPEPENMLMFPIMATLINVARLRLRGPATVGDPQASSPSSATPATLEAGH